MVMSKDNASLCKRRLTGRCAMSAGIERVSVWFADLIWRWVGSRH